MEAEQTVTAAAPGPAAEIPPAQVPRGEASLLFCVIAVVGLLMVWFAMQGTPVPGGAELAGGLVFIGLAGLFATR